MFEGTRETILYIILGIILAFGVNTGLAFALSTDMPVVAVESDSMVPTFHKGDMLIIQGVADREYSGFLKVGDIIVFSPEGKQVPIVHRVITINEDGTYQTMGDANKGMQLPFEKQVRPVQIHGKMLLIIPYLGWIKIGVTEYIFPNLFWAILLIILLFVVYGFFYKK